MDATKQKKFLQITILMRKLARSGWPKFKAASLYFCLAAAMAVAGCSSPDRSRALDDSTTPAETIALQVCSNCHGLRGISVSPNFPNLAAQSESYIVEQLKSFKNHGRSDPAGFEYMWGMSARLTDEQINGLAAYFSSQQPPPGKSQNPLLLKDGQMIFENGIAARNTPACSGCHGAKGEGMQQFPRLAGQHADYIVKQLVVFQKTEQRPEGSLMKAVTHELTAQDMKHVAAYLEALTSAAK